MEKIDGLTLQDQNIINAAHFYLFLEDTKPKATEGWKRRDSKPGELPASSATPATEFPSPTDGKRARAATKGGLPEEMKGASRGGLLTGGEGEQHEGTRGNNMRETTCLLSNLIPFPKRRNCPLPLATAVTTRDRGGENGGRGRNRDAVTSQPLTSPHVLTMSHRRRVSLLCHLVNPTPSHKQIPRVLFPTPHMQKH